MSALATRAHVHNLEHCYLSPLPQTGKTATQMSIWIQQGLDGSRELRPVFSQKLDKNGEQISLGQGYEFTRTCSVEQDENRLEWEERVLLICSHKYSETKLKNLKKRLTTATENF